MSDEINIDPMIKFLTTWMPRVSEVNLLQQVRDTCKAKELTPEAAYGRLLTLATQMITNMKAENVRFPHTFQLHATGAAIVSRQYVFFGIFFVVVHGELVEHDRECWYPTLRGQLGRVWN